MKSNLSWNEYFMRIARDVARRSTCLRRNYGALIVKNNKICATGYNGAASGMQDCHERGYCYREKMGIDHGSCYDSNCLAVHAEANAIINASPEELFDSTIYIWGEYNNTHEPVEKSGPCIMCYRMIRNAHIGKIVILHNGNIEEYETKEYEDFV